MLPPVDISTYSSIAKEKSKTDSCGIRRAKAYFEEENLAFGVYSMLEAFSFCRPVLRQDPKLDNWRIDLNVS